MKKHLIEVCNGLWWQTTRLEDHVISPQLIKLRPLCVCVRVSACVCVRLLAGFFFLFSFSFTPSHCLTRCHQITEITLPVSSKKWRPVPWQRKVLSAGTGRQMQGYLCSSAPQCPSKGPPQLNICTSTRLITHNTHAQPLPSLSPSRSLH